MASYPPSGKPVDSPPEGLPDIAALAQMASAMFSAGLENIRKPAAPQELRAAASPEATTAAVGTPALSRPPLPLGSPTALGGPTPTALVGHSPAPSTAQARPPTDMPMSSPYYFIGEAVAWQPAVGDSAPTVFDSNFSNYYFINERSRPPATIEDVGFDVEAVRRDFPILAERVNGHQLVWLDNAATTQKPQAVIDRLVWFYTHENSNIHRAAHELAARATDAFEAARAKVARFIGAPSPDNIVFVRGATEAINLVAQSWGRTNVNAGDEIVISHLEHHANIVPWQQLAAQKGATLRVVPVDDSGQILLDAYRELVNERTRLVAMAHVSNALGTIVPIAEVIRTAHAAGACVLIDGAQSVAHERVNVAALDPDFYVFSGHKVFGPTGIGALYGKAEVLERMPPWQGGGSMIRDVTFEKSTFQHPPNRFEAGTGNIADAIGLGAALDYLEHIGLEVVARYEHRLLGYATDQLLSVPGLRLIGTAPSKASVLSFVLAGHTPEQVGQALNREGIAVRAGHHCAQPILRRFGFEATVRSSLAMYNTYGEVDRLVGALCQLTAASSAG
jgi:cysteine desulfurase/selenocysteine lyase